MLNALKKQFRGVDWKIIGLYVFGMVLLSVAPALAQQTPPVTDTSGAADKFCGAIQFVASNKFKGGVVLLGGLILGTRMMMSGQPLDHFIKEHSGFAGGIAVMAALGIIVSFVTGGSSQCAST